MVKVLDRLAVVCLAELLHIEFVFRKKNRFLARVFRDILNSIAQNTQLAFTEQPIQLQFTLVIFD
jgi:hypothetical protein